MKIRQKIKYLIVMILIAWFLIPSVVSSALPKRTEVMYAIGYDFTKGGYNPFDQNPNYLVTFMYEPLFGNNAIKGDTLIPVIGTTLTWASDGLNITVGINTNANWSDGQDIKADDVIYSYELHDANRWPDLIGSTTDEVFSAITEVDENTVCFALNNPWSYKAFLYLTTEQTILPKHVLEAVAYKISLNISTTARALDTTTGWKNDWYNLTDTPLAWQVCSGPYAPYYRSDNKEIEIGKVRESWWGKNRLYLDIPKYEGNPRVPYIGIIREMGDLKINFLLEGNVDAHAGFIKDFVNIMNEDPYIESFYGRSTEKIEQPLGGYIGISMNHLRYPFIMPWFKEMLAASINYTAINVVATNGAWTKANTILLSDAQPAFMPFYDEELKNTYEIGYNVSRAEAVRDANMYLNGGQYYTNDVPAAMLTMLGPDGVVVSDDDAAHAGINILVDNLEIIVPAGWTDVEVATEYWADGLSDLGITTVKNAGDMTILWVADLDSDDYNMAMQCCGPHLANDIVTIMKDFSNPGYTGAWTYHSTNWINETQYGLTGYTLFQTAVGLMDTTYKQNATAMKEIVQAMAVILATEMPMVPSHYNSFFYHVRTDLWDGWLQSDNRFGDPVTAYTNNKYAAKTMWVLALRRGSGPTTGISWSGLEIASILGIVSVVSLILAKRRKQ